jgi:hypothetical protein
VTQTKQPPINPERFSTREKMIDFDKLEEWGPGLEALIVALMGDEFINEIRWTRPEYIEDAFRLVRDRLHAKGLANIESAFMQCSVRLYHATRLTDTEVERVRTHGLKPLRLADRQEALVELFRYHPQWEQVSPNLSMVLDALGPGGKAGVREDNRVHACFFRSAHLRVCPHYLAYGAEVDSHIGHELFGNDSANSLFRRQRKPYLISFVVPFDIAAQGCVIGPIAPGRARLVEALVGPWAYRVSNPGFSNSRPDAIAARIEGAISPSRISIEAVSEDDIDMRYA